MPSPSQPDPALNAADGAPEMPAAIPDSRPAEAEVVNVTEVTEAANATEGADNCPGKPAGRPRAADQEARLQNLLDTAACLFLEHGYGKVSLESIAREAHVAVRTIYVKFGGKAGLFNAVVSCRRAAYFSTMASLDTDMRPVREILSEFVVRFMKLISKPQAIRLNRMVIAEAEAYPELAATFYQVGPGQTRAMLGGFFDRPEIKSLFRDELTTVMLTSHLLNCILGDQMSRLLFPPDSAPTEQVIIDNAQLNLELFFRAALKTA